MTTPADELARALMLIEAAALELENARTSSAAMRGGFLGDADRLLIDANAAVYGATQALGWPNLHVPDTSGRIELLTDVRASLEQMLAAARTGSPAPPYGTRARGAAGATPPSSDPFALAAVFEPHESLKAETRRQGVKLLAIGSALALLGFVVLGAIIELTGRIPIFFLIAPLPGLAIAGRGLITWLQSRDM